MFEEAVMLLDRVRCQSFTTGGDPPDRQAGSPCVCLAALPLVIALVVMLPLALSSPPYPVWVAGLTDVADADDVVLLVMSLGGAAEVHPQAVHLKSVISFLPFVATRPTRVDADLRRVLP